ncbi:hypothetical protein [Alicyclobacillus acidoterrestris]|uniref:Uncharacterized protein n=1 Tax=Alicyclobacillus acidoterrestris (strain ATCC 49025 / DSM 3922 / CIP 106132 / NCIMB 13137 / GD3B) TaxID=1356854 RepID=T0C3U2_ALIAG|nr:hypothetical protein [Alicyclobacillus acidoterrestris]EPZ47664.1 hypothetical protein N007_05245 [Alicyclobacillus acidoterrestris ATCC 49025]UNO48019.1 hypothetical protein K1I37_15200 [Alicyclobacillus acidoterrestris]
MGLMGIIVKGAMETRKAKALARINNEHAAEMAQIKAEAANLKGQSTAAIHELIKLAQTHHEMLTEILNALTGGH